MPPFELVKSKKKLPFVDRTWQGEPLRLLASFIIMLTFVLRQWYWKRKISERWASKCDATLAAYLQYPLSNAHMPQRTRKSSSPEIAVKIGTFWKSVCSTLAPVGFAIVGVAKSLGSPNNWEKSRFFITRPKPAYVTSPTGRSNWPPQQKIILPKNP